MNINNILTQFAQQELVLSHNDTEREKIKASLAHLENILRNRLGETIDHFLRFGSFTRNTILPRRYDEYSDIDLMVVFNKKDYNYSPETYRRWIHDEISNAYPNSISQKDHPAVKLELHHIMFDLVPAYRSNTFWDNTTYYIPDRQSKWIATNPNDLNEILAQKNQNYGGNIVRNVIRLCKYWNACNGYPFESYLMEKRILDILFVYGDNLYQKFISILGIIASDDYRTVNVIDSIKNAQGGWLNKPDEHKQMVGLNKLLPGIYN